jgi:predicted amino acid dehydrogenase
MACKAAAIRGGTASVASKGRSSDASGAVVDETGKVAKDMIETLVAKVGRKTFQGIANRQRRAADRRAARRSRTALTAGDDTETNMTICTSSSIRTMTVGSGIAPDLLTPVIKNLEDAGARGLTGSRFRVAGIPPVGNFTPP